MAGPSVFRAKVEELLGRVEALYVQWFIGKPALHCGKRGVICEHSSDKFSRMQIDDDGGEFQLRGLDVERAVVERAQADLTQAGVTVAEGTYDVAMMLLDVGKLHTEIAHQIAHRHKYLSGPFRSAGI